MSKKLIPLTKKALEPVVQKYLDHLIELFELSHWKIYYSVSKEKGDCCAKVRRRGGLREATITIYPRVIRELQEEGYEEPLKEVLLHEMLHVVMWDCFVNVSDDVAYHPQFLAAEEILVEALVKILRER